MFGADGNQPSYLGANFTPWPNVGQGSELPYARWVEPAAQQGTLGPGIPRPGQPAHTQPPSPNYGAPWYDPVAQAIEYGKSIAAQYKAGAVSASSTGAVAPTWTGPSKWTYQMDNSGTVKVLAEPKNKYVGMTLTPSSGKGYVAVLAEYMSLFGPGKTGYSAATYTWVNNLKTAAAGAAVTAPASAPSSAPVNVPKSPEEAALLKSMQGGVSDNTIYYVIGGVALVGGIGAAVYLLTRKG